MSCFSSLQLDAPIQHASGDLSRRVIVTQGSTALDSQLTVEMRLVFCFSSLQLDEPIQQAAGDLSRRVTVTQGTTALGQPAHGGNEAGYVAGDSNRSDPATWNLLNSSKHHNA